MPKMDGVAAARAIRSLEAAAVADGSPPRPPVRIVAITANASNEDREACLAAGMGAYSAAAAVGMRCVLLTSVPPSGRRVHGEANHAHRKCVPLACTGEMMWTSTFQSLTPAHPPVRAMLSRVTPVPIAE
jgi:hypothetical protein